MTRDAFCEVLWYDTPPGAFDHDRASFHRVPVVGDGVQVGNWIGKVGSVILTDAGGFAARIFCALVEPKKVPS